MHLEFAIGWINHSLGLINVASQYGRHIIKPHLSGSDRCPSVIRKIHKRLY